MNLMNAAGFCKDFETAKKLVAHPALSEVTVGSITPGPLVGFPNAYYFDKKSNTSYNAFSMPNVGLEEFLKQLPEFVYIIKRNKKKLRVSYAAPTIDAFREMLRKTLDTEAGILIDTLELNPNCPNKRDMYNGHDPMFIEKLVEMVASFEKLRCRVAIKLAAVPLQTPLFASMVVALKKVPGAIHEVVAINSYPDTLLPHLGNLFSHRGGYAAMAGRGLHAIALAHVRAFANALLPHIEITGCGGINSLPTVQNMILAGAWRFQVGTAFKERGANVFSEIGAFTLD